jgi:hypothetical protein
MNPRLLILIVVAAGMAIYFASIKSGSKPVDTPPDSLMTAEEQQRIDDVKKTLDKLPLAGSEPAEEPDVAVQVEVDRSKGKNRLYFTITEAHGYYVEQFSVRFWYVKAGVTGPEDSPVNITQFFDRFLPAKGTLRVCMEVVPAELKDVGGDMGDSGNWKAEIAEHGRARAQNPDPMPPRTDLISGTSSCD